MASTSRVVEGTRRLFVANLPPYAKYKDLLKAFLPDGAKAAQIVRKGEQRIAFVTFPTAEQANAALERVNREGLKIYKNPLVVRKADPWHEKGGAGPSGSRARREREEVVGEGVSFPPEVVAKIASYLPFRDRARMECVSRAWRAGSKMSHGSITKLTTSSPLWSAGWDDSLISTEAFYWALQRAGPTLKIIEIDDGEVAENLRSCILTIAAKACKSLEEVNLRATVSRPSGIRELGKCTTLLKVLKLGNTWGAIEKDLSSLFARNMGLVHLSMENTRTTGSALRDVTPGLRKLELTGCTTTRADFLAETLSGLTSLNYLALNNMRSLVGSAVLDSLANNSHLREILQVLIIHDTTFRGENLDVEDEDDMVVEVVHAPRPDLDRIQFFELEPGHPGSAVQMMINLTAVRELTLTAVGWVDAEVVYEIGAHMIRLQSLNLSLCSNIRGQFSMNPLGQLEELRIIKITNLYPDVGGSFLAQLLNLEECDCRDSRGISTEDICGLIRRAPLLKTLNLEGCRSVQRPVVTRRGGRRERLTLYLGGTSTQRCRRDRQNRFLVLHYERVTGHYV